MKYENCLQTRVNTATLNVCGLGDKLPELIDCMGKKKHLSNCWHKKKKREKYKRDRKDYILTCSGVDEKRGKHVVGFLINHNKAKCIVDIEYKSETIIQV